MIYRDMSASLSGHQFAQHEELALRIPKFPRLIPELIVVPSSSSTVSFHGSRQVYTIKCHGGLSTLGPLLDHLDGNNSIEALGTKFSKFFAGGVKGVIALLYRYGLLEDGPVPPVSQSSFAHYIGRHVGTTGYESNRCAILQRLSSTNLIISCDIDLRGTVLRSLPQDTFGSIQFYDQKFRLNGVGETYGLVIFSNDYSSIAKSEADMLCSLGITYFVGTTGSDLMQVGPLVVPKVSATHNCSMSQVPVPEKDSCAITKKIQAVYIVHEFIRILSKISSDNYINKVVVHAGTDHKYLPVTYQIARVPGDSYTTLEGCERVDQKSLAFKIWLHHTSTRMPPHQYLPPKIFESHFKVSNLNLYASQTQEDNSGLSHALPDYSNWGNVIGDNRDEHCRSSTLLTIEKIASILKYSVGEQIASSGERRRISPSAGHLRSCSFYLVANKINGLGCGVYRYDSFTHSLVKSSSSSFRSIQKNLYGNSDEIPKASLICVSNFERVKKKYGDFALNLCYLDSGVVSEYASIVADALSVSITERFLHNRSELADNLKLDTENGIHIVGYCIDLFDSTCGVDSNIFLRDESTSSNVLNHSYSGRNARSNTIGMSRQSLNRSTTADMDNFAGLETVILNRRAHYAYGLEPVESKKILRLVDHFHRSIRDVSQRTNFQPLVVPWLVVLKKTADIESGIYNCASIDVAKWVKHTCSFPTNDFRVLFNQESFLEASFVIIAMGKLKQALANSSDDAYRAMMQQAGSSIAACWLEACGLGLVGTAAGGLIEAGFMRYAGINGYDESPMFGLVLANPSSEHVL